ncbi:MAG: DUF58 domain-containing protein [Chthonomonas sp.]|nr:DUF58 domain-containing protein [Chthonomonas sp.]
MIVPTKRFWLLVALGIPLALTGIVITGFEPVVLLYNFTVFALLVGTWFLAPNPKNLRASRMTDEVLSVNARNVIELVLENMGSTTMKGRVLDESPPDFISTQRESGIELASGETMVLRYQVKPRDRGAEVFPCTLVRFMAPLGLCEVQHRLPTQQSISVYPNIKAIQEFDLLNQRGKLALMGVRRTRYRGQGTEFESLREYAHDDFRRIDWKTTARRGKLVVRDYEVERNQAVFIIIDASRHMLSEAAGRRKLDHILDTALLLMHAAERAGDQVGLIVFAERLLKYVPPRRGRAHINMLLDGIHDLVATPVEANYAAAMHAFASRWTRRALVVAFTDMDEPREARAFLRAIQPMRSRHLWFLARVMDPRLRELGKQPVTNQVELYSAGAYEWYRMRRDEARAELNNAGIKHIEAEPETLAAELVNAYWHAKQTGAI